MFVLSAMLSTDLMALPAHDMCPVLHPGSSEKWANAALGMLTQPALLVVFAVVGFAFTALPAATSQTDTCLIGNEAANMRKGGSPRFRAS